MTDILLLGPDRYRAGGIRSILRQEGYEVVHLRSVDRWREAEKELLPELILAAVGSSESLADVPARPASRFPAPVLFVQHEGDSFSERYLDERLVDRVVGPLSKDDLLARVDALVRSRRLIRRVKTDDGPPARRHGVLWGISHPVAALTGVRRSRYDKPLAPYLEVATRIADWADRRDAFEPGHAERVTSFSAAMADGLGLPDRETALLLRAAMLHDIGKVALPVEMLWQKDPLSEEQRRLIRTHPKRGAALIRALDGDEEVAEVVLFHHEQPDGAGYYGKQLGSIPRMAAILGVAEAFDAMTSTRLQRPLPTQAALDLLHLRSGQKYDPECVEALVDVLKPLSTTIPLSDRFP